MAFDFSGQYGSQQFSDLELVLYEEETEGPVSAGSKRKATPRATLPGHAIVLCNVSPYFKAKLENWSDQDAAPTSSTARRTRSAHQPDQHSKQTVELPVPPGQLSVGQLLVKSMYHAQLDLASVPQAQLLQLLLLADRYEVAKSLAAAAAALKAIPTQAFEWETVLAVHALPAACAGNPTFQPLFAAAAAKVCQELGDLEAVCLQGSDEQLARLLSLPFGALLRLLENSATRVQSENTVASTVARWYEWQQAHSPAEQQPTHEQLRQLVGAIRMQHCSRLYVSTLFASEDIAAAALKPRELAQASGMAGLPAVDATLHTHVVAVAWPVLATFPAWGDAKRPASAVGSVVLDWSVSRQELKQLVQQALDSNDTRAELPSDTWVFMGYPLFLELEVVEDDSGSTAAGGLPGKPLELGVSVYVDEAGAPAVCIMKYCIRAKQPTAAGGQYVMVVGRSTSTFKADGTGWGRRFALGVVAQPSDALQVLQQRHSKLLADDGGMHLRLEVSAMH